MTEKTYQALSRSAAECVKKHRSVVLDATFGGRVWRDEVKKRLVRTGVSYCFIEVVADDALVKQRLKERDGEPADVSDARLEDFDKLNRLYEAPSELKDRERLTASSKDSREVTLIGVLKKLIQLQLETTP